MGLTASIILGGPVIIVAAIAFLKPEWLTTAKNTALDWLWGVSPSPTPPTVPIDPPDIQNGNGPIAIDPPEIENGDILPPPILDAPPPIPDPPVLDNQIPQDFDLPPIPHIHF